ncbi:redox-regulated ATPase YchF [candidate division KSB1 bacterium]|nr:redox-regulated ATPase YchF [candidate division KSB1 bacterium]
MKIGIVGLPQSGKTTLFNALTGAHAAVGYGGGKERGHVAVVKVPDERLDRLVEMFKPQRQVPVIVEYDDVIGLAKGASQKAGFSGEFLNRVKANDALLAVVRAFGGEKVPHPEGSVDPRRDIGIIEAEFLLSDLAIVENRADKLSRQLKKVKDDQAAHELRVLELCKGKIEEEIPLREIELAPKDERVLHGFQLLTAKPLLIVLNLGEDLAGKEESVLSEYGDLADRRGMGMVGVCSELEMEISELEEQDAGIFREEMGLKEAVLDKLIRASYGLLELISFFTVIHDEVHAWTIKQGTPAVHAAGAVHSDMERGFIRAEVVHYHDLMAQGSLAKCREKGLVRLEGKDYPVQDGDVIQFRFHV